MPVLILIGIFAVWGVSSAIENCGKNNRGFDKKDLDNILKETCGKSKKEARSIIRKYRR